MRSHLVVACGLLAVVAGCKPPPPPVHTAPTTVQQLARVTIPPSATNVMCRTDRDDVSQFELLPALDHRYWGRFDIPAADLPLVLAGAPKDTQAKPFTGDSKVLDHARTEAWWQPRQLRDPQVAEWSAPGFSINLLIGITGQDGMLTVYFANSEM